MIQDFVNLYCFFFIYSFLGWVTELIYSSVTRRGWKTRVKSVGPLHPGYGVAALIILTLLYDYRHNPFIIFVAGGLLASVLEYTAGYAAERFLGAKLWDYSGKAFNLHGRICLENSLLFAMLCVVFIVIIHPLIRPFVLSLGLNLKFLFMIISLILLVIENTIVVMTVFFVKLNLREIRYLWNQVQSMNPNRFDGFTHFMNEVQQRNLHWQEDYHENSPQELYNSYDFVLQNAQVPLSDAQSILLMRTSQMIVDRVKERPFLQKLLYKSFQDLKFIDYQDLYQELKKANH